MPIVCERIGVFYHVHFLVEQLEPASAGDFNIQYCALCNTILSKLGNQELSQLIFNKGTINSEMTSNIHCFETLSLLNDN